jgi:hypothetical protein
LVEWLKERSIRCEVIACGISKELKEAADHWEELSEDQLEPVTEEVEV